MRLHVPPEQLWTEFQGDLDFEYDHVTYWPALLKLCDERHAELKARWIEAGKNYGESEVYLKGGDAPSVGSQKSDQETPVTQEKEKEIAVSKTDAVEQSNGTEVNGAVPEAVKA